ncbi:hypothetical protein Glove_181g50 [Diversispora epigaea]|uniref:Uncharacterized protein n=1 Tax=Diversispora epigaea TaxID=1348612 RepID=A0A397IR84_9GLOM|nr:hypothetical protein Glove_181g50 [Diversispora epigaea]
MAFQWEIVSNNDLFPEVVQINEDTQLFGMNLITQTALDTLQSIIENLLKFQIIDDNLIYNQDFDAETIKEKTISKFKSRCHGFFQILTKCVEKWSKLRPLLGAWHISKDFCSVLLVLFSSYGILNFAHELGTAVGFSINIYIKKKEMSLHSIMDGIWKAHRIGIRNGNHNLQRNCLSAAALLFASVGKNNYTTSIIHYLSTLAKYLKLNQILQEVGAFKLSTNNNNKNSSHICFAFDEALETFGVRFIKQNITEHSIFKKYIPSELNKEGCEKLIACYPNGLERIQKVYLQEVLKIEKCNITGRQTIGVKKTRHQEYKKASKTKKKK